MIANQVTPKSYGILSVCRMNFVQFAKMASSMDCKPNKYKHHIGDNVRTEQEFYREGWRFVCDNIYLYIGLPATLGLVATSVSDPSNVK